MRRWIFTFFLLSTALMDLRTQTISKRWLWKFTFFGVLVFFFLRLGKEVWYLHLLSFLPGLFLFGVERLSRGAVGLGDALFFLITALYLPAGECVFLFIGGILCSGIIGLFLIIYERMKNQTMLRQRLPFLPMLLPAWLLILLS